MKKMKTLRNLLLAVFMLSAFSISTQAQWATSGTNIYNTNSGFVGVGTSTAPASLFHVSRNMFEPMMIIQNRGQSGGATYQMIDDLSGANWTFKATQFGGFKIRDHAAGLNVFTIEQYSAANVIYIGSNGVVGFGTDAPDLHYGNKLDVKGDITLEDANAWLEIKNTTVGSNAGINFREDGVYTAWMWYDGLNDLLRFNADIGGNRNDLIIKSSGQVCIGTTTAAVGYQLSVYGNIACEEVLVQDIGSWPDYVFTEGYKLMNLKQLEKSIQKDHRLPGLPSAADVEENGVSLGEMQSIFLEKLEELTLYTIEQGKQLEEHQKKIEKLEKENRKLRRLK